MTKLFSDSIGVAELLKNAKEKLALVTDDNVVQLIHRGNPVRVIMTQEHYLNLLDKIDEKKAPDTREYVDEAEVENALEVIRRKLASTKGIDLDSQD